MSKDKMNFKEIIKFSLATGFIGLLFGLLFGRTIIGGFMLLDSMSAVSPRPYRDHYGLLIFGLLGMIIGPILLFSKRMRNSDLSPLGKSCSNCGIKSKFGYSKHAEEELKKIKPMCLRCLITQLEKDYSNFTGQAVVIQPTAGPPCYVFQPVKEWQEYFKESKISNDVYSLITNMVSQCNDCGQEAKYLWINSKGLNGDNFSETLDQGLSETLLKNNPKPVSLCAKCTTQRIEHDLKLKQLSYLEVCGPNGVGNGFVIPMGY